MPNNPITKQIRIVDSAGRQVQLPSYIGAEAQFVDVSRDSDGKIILDVTPQGVDIQSVESVAASIKNLEENGIQNIKDSPINDNIGGVIEGATKTIENYELEQGEYVGIIPNIASGDFAHAEGISYSKVISGVPTVYNTIASGKYSHAEGCSTLAQGRGAHAEGYQTSANWDYTHAEGYKTLTNGPTTHAEGYETLAENTGCHSEGWNTTAYGLCSHTEGRNTIANGYASHAEGGMWHGETNESPTLAEGDGAHAEGLHTTANSEACHSEGFVTLANGGYSHAEGAETTASGIISHAEGDTTLANGDYGSHAEGHHTTANGENSHAEGNYTKASGNSSHAEGSSTIASGSSSHVEGIITIASGEASHAEGYNTTASGGDSHAEGNETLASGILSHAEGCSTIASGRSSHAEGEGTTASGNYSHAAGWETLASNFGSHAEGSDTTASGAASHAEGSSTLASGEDSHTEGNGTRASANTSHAEGFKTLASSKSSHAEGYKTTASGYYSHAAGIVTIANYCQTVVGQYNASKGSTDSYTANSGYFIVGSGTSDSAKANCFRVTETNTYGKTYATSGADYAEMFEWLDGNINSEDRIGKFVTLDEDKIKLATSSDDYILGIVSGNASVIGDVYDDQWQGIYETDIYGRPIYEKQKRELEDGTKVYNDILKVNPNYDNTQEYIPRSKRPEWDAVGLVGKLICIDDSTSVVNGYVKVTDMSIATKSNEKTRFRVLKRLDQNHIQIMIL